MRVVVSYAHVGLYQPIVRRYVTILIAYALFQRRQERREIARIMTRHSIPGPPFSVLLLHSPFSLSVIILSAHITPRGEKMRQLRKGLQDSRTYRAKSCLF